jgi:hypothetical protein
MRFWISIALTSTSDRGAVLRGHASAYAARQRQTLDGHAAPGERRARQAD